MQLKEIHSSLLKETTYVGTHESGLSLYLHPKHTKSYTCLLVVHYGAFHNGIGEGQEKFPDGIAHFLEHKLFENEDGTDSMNTLAEFGMDGNAFTSGTMTAYTFNGTGNWKKALRELLTYVTHPCFKTESIEREKGIIIQEMKMEEDVPHHRLHQALLRAMYHTHPIKDEIVGTESSVQSVTPETLYDCYHANYRLSDMSLIFCGDFRREDVIPILDECLSANRPGNMELRQKKKEPADERGIVSPEVTLYGAVTTPYFSVGIKDDVASEPAEEEIYRSLCMDLIAHLLYSTSTAFHDEITQKGLVYGSFRGGYTREGNAGYFSFSGTGNGYREILEKMKRILHSAKKNGLSDEDILISKRVFLSEYIRSFDSSEAISDELLDLSSDNLPPYLVLDLLKKINREDLESYLRQIPEENFVLAVMKGNQNVAD